MSIFKSTCHSCSSTIDVPNVYVGRHVKCPICGNDFLAEPSIDDVKNPTSSPSRITSNIAPKKPNIAPKKHISSSQRVFSRFSIKIEKDELIFHRYCRFVGWLSVILAILGFLAWIFLLFFTDETQETIIVFSFFLSMMFNAAIHFGLAQIIKIIHSMAYNTQAIKIAQVGEEIWYERRYLFTLGQ